MPCTHDEHHTARQNAVVREQYSAFGLAKVLPKAELHLHIEGTFEPDLMLTVAKRNGLLDRLPFATVEEARAAYQFTNLQSFLDLYFAGCNVLQKEQDFYDLTMAYMVRAAEDIVVHVELFFDPQLHTRRGIPFATCLKGIERALMDAETSLGMSAHIIMCFLRDLGPEAAGQAFEEALPHKSSIVAIGLDSAEAGYPPSMFTALYSRASALGFRLVAHCGEEGPPQYIWQGLDDLNVHRIDHGVRCIEDAALLKRLQALQVPLTVCPLSNLKLKVYEGHLVEKFRMLFSHGLCLTINSDDPAYFGGYILANYEFIITQLSLGPDEVLQLHKNAFTAAFLSDKKRQQFLGLLESVFKEFGKQRL